MGEIVCSSNSPIPPSPQAQMNFNTLPSPRRNAQLIIKGSYVKILVFLSRQFTYFMKPGYGLWFEFFLFSIPLGNTLFLYGGIYETPKREVVDIYVCMYIDICRYTYVHPLSVHNKTTDGRETVFVFHARAFTEAPIQSAHYLTSLSPP